MTASRALGWYTAAEIARLGLPGLPDTTRRVADRAAADGWTERTASDGTALARPRRARGGGTEYHASLFPPQAQELLIARARTIDAPIAANDEAVTLSATAERWAWFEEQNAKAKATAAARIGILAEVEASAGTGVSKTAAIGAAARRHGYSARAIAGWFGAVSNVDKADRLPFLAPSYKGGGKEVEIDAEAWRILKTDYLRAERPAFAACYNRLLEDYARPRGIALPDVTTLKRRLDKEIRPTLKRRSGRGVRRCAGRFRHNVAASPICMRWRRSISTATPSTCSSSGKTAASVGP